MRLSTSHGPTSRPGASRVTGILRTIRHAEHGSTYPGHGWPAPLPFPDQIGIAFVFEDRHAILLAQTEHLAAPCQGHDRAHRILQCGNSIDVLGGNATLAESVKSRGQGVHAHTLFIQGMPTMLT